MLKIKRIDHIQLTTIYKKVNKSPIINTVRLKQLGWLGHTLRLNDLQRTEPYGGG